MTPEQIEQIIEMLAEKLGPMAEVVWEAYVAQAALTAMHWTLMSAVLGILTLTSLGFLIVFIGGGLNKDQSDGDREFCWASSCVDGIVFVVLLLMWLWVSVEAYMRLNNPAYYAIQMLLGR